VLDEETAARTWNWLLTRQGLTDSKRLTSAWDAADAALGLHAARLPSPYAMVAARTDDSAIPGSLFTAPVRASLLTLRCMRKTLHTLPLHLAPAAHTATIRFRERDARRTALNAGYGIPAIDDLISQVSALLRESPLPHRIIETRLAQAGHDVRAIRSAIKIAWECGTFTYINSATTWNRESRTFALTASAYPAVDLSLPRGEAITALVTAYFHRYGPATIRDATWWSGLSAADITAGLLNSGRPLLSVTTPWSKAPCLMFADQADEALTNEAVTGVQLLAHEDSALKAYHQTRIRYLAGIPQRRAFNQIGEALPTIIVNGMVAGIWTWDNRTCSVRTSVIAGRTTPAIRRQIRTRAAAMTQTLRTSWTPTH
jgi:Winged helix DNA-binding domain